MSGSGRNRDAQPFHRGDAQKAAPFGHPSCQTLGPMKTNSLLLLIAICPWLAYAQSALPPDVTRFAERRDLCDHFRGEEPYDAERRKFLETRVRELCTGTDRKLLTLKSKYKASLHVLSRLNEYEPAIEGSSK